MQIPRLITMLVIAVVLLGSTSQLVVSAAPTMAVPAGLSLLEIKVTGEEFILMQNNSGATITDLSSYWLTAYNNVSPLAGGVSTSSQQLPIVSLLPLQTILLSASPMQTCGASVAGKLSVSLSDGGGFLQLSRMGFDTEGAVEQTPGDYVSWSSGANGIIQNLPTSTKNSRAAYYRYFNGGSYFWQQADLDTSDSCQLNIVVAGGLGSSSAVTPLTLAATSPPATILGNESGPSGPAAVMPAADIGLMAPQISELLPNPSGTGNDNSEEFIELYNPNAKPFDLTGFTLQTGITKAYNFVFPAGVIIPPQTFRAFYSSETKVTLSNTGSQAALLDPFGNVISVTDTYSSAKDGIAWASAKNAWYWTTQPTPSKANVIKQPVTRSKSSSTKTSAKKVAVKGSSTNDVGTSAGASSFEEEEEGSVIHTWVLAVVGGVALLYGAYEYRRDITNRLHQLRTKLGFRRPARQEVARERSD